MAVTIRDVAAAAGVSLTTVSHALSNQGRIGQSTRERVLQVAADLGYTANVHAQQLVTNRSRTLAIQVAPFDPASESSMLIPNSEYFLELLNGASAEAGRSGYALVLTPPGVGPKAVTAFAVDGAIVVDPHGDEGLLDPSWTSSHPVVTAGRAATRGDTPHIVDNDHQAATTNALEHMWEQGFRRPAAIITDRARSYTRDVVDAYTAFAHSRGIRVQTVETGSGSGAGDALRQLLDSGDPPDAVYAGSEDIAMDVLQAAVRSGIRVPTDLGLCSCVDSSTFNLTCPEITGVCCHPRTIGERAVALLIDAGKTFWHWRMRMKTLVISASPREDGNSHVLADAAVDGTVAAGHDAEHVFLDDYVARLLDNCLTCRRASDGRCSLDDRYEELLLEHLLPADGIVFAMPLYFYGMPGRLKTVFDRLFCYTANSAPQQQRVIDGIMNKKVGVVISCEESYVGATAGVVAQFQELTRYLNQDLVGVVVGNANSRGEIRLDPTDPVSAAFALGRRLYTSRVTDYRLDTVRSNRVWGDVAAECVSASSAPAR